MTKVIDVRHYHGGSLPEGFKEMLIDVHADSYSDVIHEEFNQRFPWFVDHWSDRKDFTCVVAFDGAEPTGFAYGAPLAPGREWWRDTDFEPNNGHTGTFAVSEVMVRPPWRKLGIAHQLHEELLKERNEDLSVLLVDVTHPKVQNLYETWGYEKVGERRPFADSPLYAVMVKGLG
ncbi:GNAT family N-acetyltransferase [Streptomyces silvensis]|uniref:GNAT family N-acetyltransferase n=1 Tax=Streptomyces silvensis TaxID=1765722 RepID=UPI00099E80B9|nr:GNAT family N-acetyltransferase [Streptomyces silvensis]